MSITGTDSLETSIKEIVQNKGLIGKVNKTNIEKILSDTCAPFEGYNKIVEYTDRIFNGNDWMSEYGHILTARGFYTGSKKTNVASLRAVLQFWSCDDIGTKKEVGIQRKNPLIDMKVGKKVIVVPSWGLSGPAAYWLFSAEQTNLFHTIGSDTGGIAYLRETERYKVVLATQNSGIALEAQALHYNKFKFHAPLILYNKRTSREEWEMLGDRKVVFLDALVSPIDKTVYQPAFDYKESRLSAVHSSSLRGDNNYSKMNAALMSGKSPYEVCRSRSISTGKARAYCDKVFLRSLDLSNFFEFILSEKSASCLDSLDLGWTVDPGNRITYRGEVIEETPNGYAVVNDYGLEEISNFTVDLHGLFRLQEADNLVYTGTIRIDDKMVPVIFDHKDISSSSPRVESVFQKATVDAGVGMVPFLSYGWSKKIADVIKLFNSDVQAEIVCESINTFNEKLDKYYFPGLIMDGEGGMVHQGLVTTEAENVGLHLRKKWVDAERITRFTKSTTPIVMEIISYVAYALLAQRNSSIEARPLLVERSGRKNNIISRMLPRKIGGVDRVFLRELTLEDKQKYAGTFTIMEVSDTEVLGAEGYGFVLSEKIPQVTFNSDAGSVTMESTTTSFIMRSLRKGLSMDSQTLEDIRSEMRTFLTSYSGPSEDPMMSLEHGVLTQEECIQRCEAKGIELNQFVKRVYSCEEEIKKEG